MIIQYAAHLPHLPQVENESSGARPLNKYRVLIPSSSVIVVLGGEL